MLGLQLSKEAPRQVIKPWIPSVDPGVVTNDSGMYYALKSKPEIGLPNNQDDRWDPVSTEMYTRYPVAGNV
ncbi:hypothetical protein RUM44_000277 [Polyplax serrata]|uniref:Uncharacterized protein n=1 Tax=Polyplax serrata TaxID=468196 RepID=A0ABR1B4Z2_POLSC